MKINEKIYLLRKEHNLSQENLANQLGVSRQTVSKWETGESCPDFDKIVPICDLFNISTEELLRDKKVNNCDCDNEKKVIVKAIMICISIFLYFISIITIVVGEEYFHLNEGLLVGIFFLICGFATSLLVFTCMTRPNKMEVKETVQEEKNSALDFVVKIVFLIFVCLYLLVSFLTAAWHLTWIIFIIYIIVVEIIELIFKLKEGDYSEK